MSLITKFAFDQNDSEEIQQEKFAIFLVAGGCCLAGCIWTLMYYFVFGIGLTTLLPLSFVIIVGAALIFSHYSKNHYWAVYAQIICIIFVTTFIQWSIGGVFDSGFVLAWAFCGPITALMFLPLRHSTIWLVLYLVNVAITVIFNDFFTANAQQVSQSTKELFFIMNLCVSSLVVFIFARYFVSSALNEREKANQLLLNILPTSIAQKLKTKKGIIAERHNEVSVLFADIVGFTQYSSSVSPEELVSKLDEIFQCFDQLSEKYESEKIKTIGDAYMVVSGLPTPKSNHADSISRMALDMMSAIKKIQSKQGVPFSLRIGIHCGTVVAGVIGKSKFAYDLWGDTVNLASRLESQGKKDSIQVSEQMYYLLKDDFELVRRGAVNLKGKGMTDTYYLIGVK